MTTTEYFGPQGALLLGASVGRGGEGQVFALADGSGRALKVYDNPDAAREAKVCAMVTANLSQSCANVAFPQEVARYGDGSFAGFTMALVEGGQPIHELYAPASRRRAFPKADWQFLLRAAINLATVFDRIHASGAVVGDINGSGVLVSSQAVIAMIDADSFQLGADHLCRVGVAEFTPPELQRRSLDGAIRTVDHDAFGLAVLVFQLLFLGRHPHAGVPRGRDVALAQAIAQGAFAYSAIRQVSMTPPQATLLLTDLPLGVRILFERAFAIGLGPRPLPSEWETELGRLEAAFGPCSEDDRHVRPRPVGNCPWCRIEQSTGRPVFGVGERNRSKTSTEEDVPIRRIVEGTLRRAQGTSGKAVQPTYRKQEVSPSRKAVEYRAILDSTCTSSSGVRFQSHLDAESQFTERFLRKRDRLSDEIDAWRGRVGAWKAARSAAVLADELRGFEQLQHRQAAALAEVEPRLRSDQIIRELAAIPVSSAKVPGIGKRRLATMSAAGISSAADISRPALMKLKGVGDRAIIALILWRDALAVDTGRRVTLAAEQIAAASAVVRGKYRPKIIAAEHNLHRLVSVLERALDDVVARSRLPDPELESAEAAFDQAQFDQRFLDLTASAPVISDQAAFLAALNAPRITTTHKPKSRATARTKTKANANTSAGCPLCGSHMLKRWTRSGSLFFGCVNHPSCQGSRHARKAKP